MAYTNLTGQVRVGVRPAVTAQQLQTATYLLDSYSGAAAAYSLRKLKNSSTSSIRVRRGLDNQETDIGFDANGGLDTTSLLSFTNISNTSKILDTYTASAAYSLRKLSTSYSGSAIRVRRSIDNAESNIGFVGNDLDTSGLLSFVNSADTTNSKLLDQYSGASAAYSLRKLSATYSGSAIRVRRSSDNQEMNIGFDAGGNLDTTTLLSFVGSGNGSVTTWYDQSGLGKNAVQTSATNQPWVVYNGVLQTYNGKPTIFFNSGYFHYFDCGYLNGGTRPLNYSSWVLARYSFSSYQTSSIIQSGNNAGEGRTAYNSISMWSNGKMFGNSGDGTNYRYWIGQTSINLITQRYLFEGHYKSNTSPYLGQIWLNGNSEVISDFAGGTAQQSSGTEFKTAIGRGGEYNGSYFQGDLQEIVMYFTDKTSVRSGISSNINSYYSIYTPTGSGFVTTWYDQSGNGRNVSQSSSSAQPRIVNNGVIDLINNKPSLKFTNGQVLISSQNVLSTGSQPYSIYGVSYNNTDSNSTLFYIGTTSLNYYNGNQFISLQVNSGGNTTQFRHFWGSSSDWYSNINTNNSQLFYSIEYSGSARYSSKNDNSVSTNNVSKNTVSPILHIGVLPSVNEYYKGYHQELILFDNYNSSTTTNIIKLNINTYYNIWSNPSYWSAFVTTWYDQSGFNKHTTQPTLSSQPTIVSNGNVITTNGKPSIYFDGANNLLQTSTAVLSTGNKSYSIYGVSYTLATSQSTLFFVGTFNPNNGIGLAVYNNVSRHYWPYNDFDSSSLFNFYQTYYSIEFDGTRRYTTVNNSLQNSLSSNKNTTNPILTIGRLSGIQSYYGYHQELILWDDYNSASASNDISTSVNSYYSIWGGIVTNGLVLNLDASKYYNTTWTDISGYGNNGTMVNSVGYTASNGGGLTLNGTNQYIDFGQNKFKVETFTMEIVFKINQLPTFGGVCNSPRHPIIGQQDWGYIMNMGTDGKINFQVYDTNGSSVTVLTQNSVVGNTSHITVKKSGTTVSIYLNGVLQNSGNMPTGSIRWFHTTWPFRIGNGQCGMGDYYMNGTVHIARFYNSALTDAQILQNFNATKSRFGL